MLGGARRNVRRDRAQDQRRSARSANGPGDQGQACGTRRLRASRHPDRSAGVCPQPARAVEAGAGARGRAVQEPVARPGPIGSLANSRQDCTAACKTCRRLVARKIRDHIGRHAGQWLSEHLGQQFVIENKPGFGGNIATEYVVSAPPDGYTILMPVSTNAVNATLYPNLSFNFIRDIAPIAGIGKTPFVVVVPASFPAKTLLEFITYAKANPGKINMASVMNSKRVLAGNDAG